MPAWSSLFMNWPENKNKVDDVQYMHLLLAKFGWNPWNCFRGESHFAGKYTNLLEGIEHCLAFFVTYVKFRSNPRNGCRGGPKCVGQIRGQCGRLCRRIGPKNTNIMQCTRILASCVMVVSVSANQMSEWPSLFTDRPGNYNLSINVTWNCVLALSSNSLKSGQAFLRICKFTTNGLWTLLITIANRSYWHLCAWIKA